MQGTLLIIDPRQNLRMLYDHELHEEGYRILLAADEDDALKIVQHECPDLIIVDGQLVLTHGTHTIAKLKSFCDHTLIVVNDADHRSCKELLCSSLVDDCIVKSSDIDSLKEIIKTILSRKQSMKGNHEHDKNCC
jgi:DNA-binding response OmpR family regulator